MTRDTLPNMEASQSEIEAAIKLLVEGLNKRIAKHGRHKWRTRSESLGVLVEEYHELVEAKRINGPEGMERFLDEMLDVAVTGVWAQVSFRNGTAAPPS
jgi:hypothetical protein